MIYSFYDGPPSSTAMTMFPQVEYERHSEKFLQMDFKIRVHVCTVNTEQALLLNNPYNKFSLGNLMTGVVISTCGSLPCSLHEQNKSHQWAALNDFTDTCVNYPSSINTEGCENEMLEIASTPSKSQWVTSRELHFVWTQVQRDHTGCFCAERLEKTII